MNKLVIFFLIAGTVFSQSGNCLLSGKVYDKLTSEPLVNCNVIIVDSDIGTNSDLKGNYQIRLSKGTYLIRFSYVGYKSFEKQIEIIDSEKLKQLSIPLLPKSVDVGEVKVVTNRDLSSTIVQNVKQKDLKKMPTVYGDVLRVIQILPGVTANNELSSGYNVRGGSFDENLIYLNGYEIYRPALLQSGIEENQSLANPDLTNEINFYNGTFPARFGDKMSSAVEINYENFEKDKNITGVVRANLLNSGIALKTKYGNLKAMVGFRYSYPSLFLNRLHGKGTFEPSYNDLQILLKYNLNKTTEFEFFSISAQNKYNNQPEEWVGHIRTDSGTALVQAVTAVYKGDKSYSFKTRLFGTKFKHKFNSNTSMLLQGSYYSTKEDEKRDLISDYYFSPDATFPEDGKTYLKTRDEFANNFYEMKRWELKTVLQRKSGDHNINFGMSIRLFELINSQNEKMTERGEQPLFDKPIDIQNYWKSNLRTISGFIEDNFVISNILYVNAGVRFYHYNYNDEVLFSPRVNIQFWLSEIHKFSFSWGYYYQPPFYYELRNNNPELYQGLVSQRAIHYVLGWEYQFEPDVSFQAEAYYKKLDNLIPFYLDKMKLEYSNNNGNQGYAYGLDLVFNGQITKGMRSWISYSYLNTKEKGNGVENYIRRILDQNHTFQIFLQDKIRKRPNWQSHLRLVFGTGYLFHNRETAIDENGQQQIEVLWDSRDEYSMYYRADMGLSANFKMGNNTELLVVVEVLNVFNNFNYAGYEWLQLFKSIKHPFKIPQIFSKRFFNIGAELSF